MKFVFKGFSLVTGSQRWELNPRPLLYESIALPTELRWQLLPNYTMRHIYLHLFYGVNYYEYMNPENLEKVVGAPAVVLDSTVQASRQFAQKVSGQRPFKSANKFWKNLGPGLTTGAADDDPSGIATYSQTGAQYGLGLLWLAGFTFPLMAVVQEMCARLGMVSGRGLAANIRKNYPRPVLYTITLLLFITNTVNIGADLGAMAKASQLIFPNISFVVLIVFFTIVSLLLQIYSTYEKYAKYLKYLALILVSYVLSGFLVNLSFVELLQNTIYPSIVFNREQIILICAILGTTISPYLFFWQTSQEVEESIMEGKVTLRERQIVTRRDIRNMRVDVWSGMFISNLVMYFIIATCAATLFANGITTVSSAAEAAAALRPLAGEFAYLLFTFGIVGTGLLAVPILAGSSSYAISESFGWKHGLNKKLKRATAFYGAIMISMLIGLVMNFIGIDPIKALIYSAVLNGIIAPVIIVFIVLLSSNEKIMGEFKNNAITTFIGWSVAAIMLLAGSATIWALFW